MKIRRARVRSWGTVLSLCCVVILTALALYPFAVAADDDSAVLNALPSELRTADYRQPAEHPLIESRLRRVVREAGEVGLEPAAAASLVDTVENTIRVVVECEESRVATILADLEKMGVSVEETWKGQVQCLIPPELVVMAADLPGVHVVRAPLPPSPRIESEALGLINALEWHSSSLNGSGVKVGILDVGFAGYSDLLGGELPASVTTRWAPGLNGPGSSVHGTACAEIVHDVAPAAELFLANLSTDTEFGPAVEWLIGQGVDVISCSIGWINVGPRDGTGWTCEPVDDARAAGALWSEAAGNYATCHWRGQFQGSEGLHQFSTDPDYTNEIYLLNGETVFVSLTWDDPWGEATNDYDLLVLDDEFGMVKASENEQSDGYPHPYEGFPLTATYEGLYHIVVPEWETSRDCLLEIFVDQTHLQYQTAAGSIGDKSTSDSATSVGAVAWDDSDTIEWYSSQGPTRDGRVRPDIVAPVGVSTASYGLDPFHGTSAAAPHVAGAAALVKQAYPSYGPGSIQSYLGSNAVELGADGKDNIFGSGRLLLPSAPQEPTVRTDPATDMGTNSATMNMSYTTGYHDSVDVRFAYREADAGTWTGTSWQNKSGDGSHSHPLTGLASNTLYEFRAELRYDTTEVIQGEILQFTTGDLVLQLKSGWNMVSVPLVLTDGSPDEVLPGIEAIYTWDPDDKCYYTPASIETSHGYWVAVAENKTIAIAGDPVDQWNQPICAGWNMIGSISETMSVDDLEADAGDPLQTNAMYWWNPTNKSYESADNITYGRGYWLASTGDCTVTLGPPGSS